MDKRTLIAVAICILFYLGYTKYLQNKYPGYGEPPEVTMEDEPADSKKSPETKKPETIDDTAVEKPKTAQVEVEKVPELSKEELRLENDVVIYQFNQALGAIESIRLKKFKTNDKKPKRVELVTHGPIALQGTTDLKQMAPLSGYSATRDQNSLSFSRKEGDWLVTQTFTLAKAGYGGTLDVKYKNLGSRKELDAGLFLGQGTDTPESSGFLSFAQTGRKLIVAGIDGSHEEELVKDRCEAEEGEEAHIKATNESIDFVGFDEQYFVKILQPQSPKFHVAVERAKGPGNCYLFVMASQNQGQIAKDEQAELKFKTYFGPKDSGLLAAVDAKLEDVDYMGWFTAIARPLLIAVKAIDKVTGNYGTAIIILTIILKLLFYPLTRAAAVSMKKMQKFQPEIQKIKEKYKDDRQTQQKELMAFMSQHKINPAKGCLPILPQIPVFIAFYNVLSHSIELRHAPFYGWIIDLSAPDPLFITPILLGVGMLVQQKLTPNPTMDKTQERIMMIMPIMFTAMFFSMPAGMVLYMITNTIVSIAQQQWLNKRLHIHTSLSAKA